MMLFSIICAVMYFISAIILFMPKFRKYPFFKPFGVYMTYQGIWTLLSYLVNQLFPTNQVMTVFNYLGSFVFCLYFLFVYVVSQKKSGKSGKHTKKAKKSKPAEEKRSEPKRRTRYRDEMEEIDDFDEVLSSARRNHFAKPETDSQEQNTEKESKVKSDASDRFAENSKGDSKYSLSDDDLYDDLDDYGKDDEDDEDAQLENVEITDEDLEYNDDDEKEQSDEDEEVDLYDDFDDDLLDDEDEKEENLPDDDDDLYDFDDDDDDSFTLKGRRYKK